MKNKKLKLTAILIGIIIISTGLAHVSYNVALTIVKATNFISNPLGDNLMIVSVRVPKAQAEEKVYAYNEQVPIDVVRLEIVKQARDFGNDKYFMLALADCESDFNNLADNPISTAKGVYQFVALTWEATESNKNKISEFDYKANIREANIKIANGEYSHWDESLDCARENL